MSVGEPANRKVMPQADPPWRAGMGERRGQERQTEWLVYLG